MVQIFRMFLLGILVVLFNNNVASATNYFVSVKTGNDSNNGSENSPFKTITKASSVLNPGDICYISSGVYREQISPKNSGLPGNPITYKSYGSGKVIVSATELVSTWTLHSGSVYKANVTMALKEQNMVYFKGEAMDWARWPNNTDGNIFTIDAELVDNGTSSQIQSSKIPNNDWTGAYVWYLGGHCGTSWTRPILSSSAGKVNFQEIDVTKWPFNPQSPTIVRNGNRGRFFLFGALHALDIQREWFYDDKNQTLYFQAPGNVKPIDGEVEYAARKETVLLNTNYIIVDGIFAFGGRVHITGNNCEIRNSIISNGLEVLDELNNTDAQITNGSINIEGSNTIIDGNIIEKGSANGISILASWKGSTNNTVSNNIIRNFNSMGIHSNPIRSNCTKTTIKGNTIYTCGRDGIYVSGANSEISWNDVYDCMLINNDGGVFYTVGNASSKNTSIHHNWFHDSYGPKYADGRAAGIYLDNDSKGYDVHHNVVWNITWSGVQMNWDNWNNNIFNNTLWSVGGAMANWLNGRTLIDNKIYNNYANTGEWIGNDFKANFISPISQFVSVENKNFMPSPNSILIDNGIEIPGFTDGFKGLKPDIGAYETGAEYWIPGVKWNETLLTYLSNFSETNFDAKIYPVPARDYINLEISSTYSGPYLVNLYTGNGNLISTKKYLKNESTIAINIKSMKLLPGIYYAEIISSDFKKSLRFVVI